MIAPALQTALRACAAGLYPLEAGVDLLIAHAWLLDRSDFRDRFVHHGISITDGITDMAEIDWAAAINALCRTAAGYALAALPGFWLARWSLIRRLGGARRASG